MKFIFIVIVFVLSLKLSGQELKRFVVKSESESIRKEFTAYDDSANTKHGLYEYYYNNILLVRGTYNNGIKHGTWLHYNTKNEVIIRSYYNEGKKIGNWKYYYDNNKLASAISYDNDKLHGKCLGYSKNGTLTLESEYVNGKNEGVSSSFYDNGNKKETTTYIGGSREGDKFKYFPNGNLHRHIIYKNNNPFSNIETYNNKKEKINGGDLLNGNGTFYNYFYETSNDDSIFIIEIENYSNGELNGKKESYYRNGKIQEQTNYENGFIIGNKITYKEDGSILSNKSNNEITKGLRQTGGWYFALANFSTSIVNPEFPGGQTELLKYLSNEVRYPKLAQVNDIEGTAYVRFVVDQYGNITKIEIAKSSGDDILDQEAISVVKSLPPWQPGFNDGIPVSVSYVLPIRFRLN